MRGQTEAVPKAIPEPAPQVSVKRRREWQVYVESRNDPDISRHPNKAHLARPTARCSLLPQAIARQTEANPEKAPKTHVAHAAELGLP